MFRPMFRGFALVPSLALALSLTFGLQGCKKEQKTVTPVAIAGDITVSVVERATLAAPESEWKDIGGILNTTYSAANTNTTKTVAFTGGFRVPVKVKVDADVLLLSKIEVLHADSRALTAYSGKELEDVVFAAPRGVSFTVIVTQGVTAAEVRIKKNQELPIDAPAEEKFTSIKALFPDPSVILTTEDIAGTLGKLKAISSATSEYHDELVALVNKAKTMDLAHLTLVLDAVYFTYQDLVKLQEAYKTIKGDDQKSWDLRNAIQKKIRLAENYSDSVNRIVAEGLARANDLTEETAIAILERLFPGGSEANEAFDNVLGKFPPKDADAKLKWMEFADRKGAYNTAGTLALSWFKNDSDRSVKTLVALSKKLKYQSKDVLILGGLEEIRTLSVAETKELVAASYGRALAVAQACLEKIQNLSGSDLADIAAILSYDAKDTLILEGLKKVPAVSVEETTKLIGASYGRGLQISQLCVSRIPGLTGNGLVSVANALSYGAKDTIISDGLSLIRSLSLSEALALIDAAYSTGYRVAGIVLEKVTPWTAEGVVAVAKKFSYGNLDQLLLTGTKRLQALTVPELATIVRSVYGNPYDIFATGLNLFGSLKPSELIELTTAAQQARLAIEKLGLGKVARLTSVELAGLAALVNYGEKDQIIEFAWSRLLPMTTAQLIALSDATYSTKVSVLMNRFLEVTDVGVASTVRIAGQFEYGRKDEAIAKYVATLKSVSTADLVTLAKATYSTLPSTLIGNLDKLTDMSLANVLTMAALLEYGKKDELVQKTYGRLAPLSTGGLISLAQAGYSIFAGFMSAHFLEATDVSVANTLKVAGLLEYGKKDEVVAKFLAQARVLSAADLDQLARATYSTSANTVIQQVTKVRDLTVANAIMLSKILSYSALDTFLLKAVDLVTDLTVNNVTTLSEAGYGQKDAILKKGLARLGRN